MRARHDAVVVGAGPAGSATAALLAARGAHVVLVDRATFPRPKPCAEYLSPATVTLLDRLDALPAVRIAGGAVVRGMRIVAPDGTEATGRFPNTPGLAIPRDLLDTALVAHAAAQGAEVVTGVTVTSLARGSGWTITLQSRRGTQTLDGDLLIGADGMHSRIARRTVGVWPSTSHRIALVTHYAGVPGMRDTGEMHVTPFGYVGIADVGGGLVSVSVVVDRRRTPPGPSAAAWFHALISRVPDIAHRLAEGRRVDRVRGVGPFGRRARRAVGHRLLLVGDAAEFFDPFTGDGIWTALRGAELVADAAAAPGGLGTYAAARRRAFASKWIVERAISAVVARPRLFNQVARRLARTPALIDTLVGVTGHVLPPSRVLQPGFLLALAR